jgi:hypothetical protein
MIVEDTAEDGAAESCRTLATVGMALGIPVGMALMSLAPRQ